MVENAHYERWPSQKAIQPALVPNRGTGVVHVGDDVTSEVPFHDTVRQQQSDEG